MTLVRKMMVRLKFSRPSQQDVAQAIQLRDTGWLYDIIRYGAYRERSAAVLGLGRIKSADSISLLIPLLWDDFESVAKSAKVSLHYFLPNANVEKALDRAAAYWALKQEKRSRRRRAISSTWASVDPLFDRSKMKMLARVKEQLKKSIRLW